MKEQTLKDIDKAFKALEERDELLDKVRAEIEELYSYVEFDEDLKTSFNMVRLEEVQKVIDKYRTESEGRGMTREEYDKIVAPVAPFEEMEKKQPMSIVEFIEEVSGRELSEWQKEFITNKYMFYKANPDGRLIARGSAKLDIEPWLAFMFDIYERSIKLEAYRMDL